MNDFASQPVNSIQQYYPTKRERIGWKLFPSKMSNFPEEVEPKSFFRDGIITNITLELDIWDRIRTLISGKIHVGVRIGTENVVGKCVTATTMYVQPPKILTRGE